MLQVRYNPWIRGKLLHSKFGVEEALEWVLSQFDSSTIHQDLRKIVLDVRQAIMLECGER